MEFGYELCLDWNLDALNVGVAVMYLSLMRYSYACEDGFWFIHDQEPAEPD